MTRLLLPLLLLLASCVEPIEDDEVPAPVADQLPTVEGLSPVADVDPFDDVAEYRLDVSAAQVELVAGQQVQAWTFNGTTPGPLVQARRGQLVRIHVTNNLDEPTTVHWHGLRIDVAMDGVVMGSIPAIEPGETFTYEFRPPDAGTFWYHPHVRSNVQIEAGLYGALIVHEDDAPDVDTDRIFVLDDVLLDANGAIAEEAWPHPTQMHGRSGNTLLINGKQDAMALDLRPGAVERWRLVNTANARTATLRFPGLEVREIGADGGLWPQAWTRSIDQLVLPVGARAELEVRLAGAEGSLEQIVLAVQDGDVVELEIPRAEVFVDDAQEPSTAAGYTADPLMPVLGSDDAETHLLEVGAVNGPDGQVVWMLNGVAWPEMSDWVVPQDVPAIIEIRNTLGPEHPFHLHGQFFTVLDRNGVAADELGLRDTVLVRGNSTVRIATDFSNPGMWMVHCHILEHAERGMMTMVEVVP